MRAIALLATLVALCAHADIFKWVDANGRTHYGEAPPPDAGAKKLNVSTGSGDAPAPAPAAATGSAPAAAPSGDKAKDGQKAPEDRAARCKYERDQLRVLEGNADVTFKNDKGEMVALDPAKREAAKQRVQENVKTYCS
jgi:hypothetical protein